MISMRIHLAPILCAICVLLAACASTRAPSPYLRAAEAGPVAGTEVRGQLLDAEGRPVKGRVRAVTEAGSCSAGTSVDGTFALPLRTWPVTLVAASTSGEIVCFAEARPSDVRRSIAVVERGAWLDLANTGTVNTRVSVRYRNVPVVDMTLRPGEPARVCVPAGALAVRFQHAKNDVHEIELAVGATLRMATDPGRE